jgi:hypothetical protein
LNASQREVTRPWAATAANLILADIIPHHSSLKQQHFAASQSALHHRHPSSPFCSVPALTNASYGTSIWDRDFENEISEAALAACLKASRGKDHERSVTVFTTAAANAAKSGIVGASALHWQV